MAVIKQEHKRENLKANYYNVLTEEEQLSIVQSEENKNNDIGNEKLAINEISSKERDYVTEDSKVSYNVDNMSVAELVNYLKLNNSSKSKN